MSPPDGAPGSARHPRRRILWFVLFYTLSLVVFTALVYFLRFIVRG